MTDHTPTPTQTPAPRIEREPDPAPRLEPLALPALLPSPRTAPGTLTLLATGTTVLATGALTLGAIHLTLSAFALSAALGWSMLGTTALGLGLIGAGLLGELRALSRLQRVDRLRRALAGPDLTRARNAARTWAASLPDAPALTLALDQAPDIPTLRALLHAASATTLRARTDALSNTAALQMLAAIAAIPSPMFDGLLVAWRGVRLVRQVAELHGMRPGLLATLALLRRTLLSAALVTAADIAANTAAHTLLSNKLLGHIAGDTAAALVAARRLRLLARAASAACSPL